MKEKLIKQRRMPSSGSFLVQVGDHVSYDTVVGELDYIPGPLMRIDAAARLGIAPQRLPDIMVRDIDDKVECGDELAIHEVFYSRSAIVSPISGYLALYSRHQGFIYVREPLPVGPKEPMLVTAESVNMNKVQFASAVQVKEEQIISKGYPLLFGRPEIVSPAICRVARISLTEGFILLKPLYQATEITAQLDGKVRALHAPDTCVIESYGHRFMGAVGFGGEANGFLEMLPSGDRDIDVNDIPEANVVQGKIVIGKRGVTLEALRLLEQHDIAGMVLGCIDLGILRAFSNQLPLKSLGKLMDIPFPIVVLQGFGAEMLSQTWNDISALSGKRAVLDASTQLRAGVVRPELLVALVDEMPDEEMQDPEVRLQLQVGDHVVLVREPHFGRSATISAIEHRLQVTAAGTRAALATVALDIGGECMVPLTNCQLLQGGEHND